MKTRSLSTGGTTYVALFRALNVGGTGRISMETLRRLAEDCGCESVRSVIQSGNLVFRSNEDAALIERKLEAAVFGELGTEHAVKVRTGPELQQSLVDCPFKVEDPKQVMGWFFSRPVPEVDRAPRPGGERLVAVGRLLWVHYPDGLGKSKLKVPMQAEGTARNLATLRKLDALASA